MRRSAKGYCGGPQRAKVKTQFWNHWFSQQKHFLKKYFWFALIFRTKLFFRNPKCPNIKEMREWKNHISPQRAIAGRKGLTSSVFLLVLKLSKKKNPALRAGEKHPKKFRPSGEKHSKKISALRADTSKQKRCLNLYWYMFLCWEPAAGENFQVLWSVSAHFLWFLVYFCSALDFKFLVG